MSTGIRAAAISIGSSPTHVLPPHLIFKTKLDAAAFRNDREQDADDLIWLARNHELSIRPYREQLSSMLIGIAALRHARLKSCFESLGLDVDTAQQDIATKGIRIQDLGREAELRRQMTKTELIQKALLFGLPQPYQVVPTGVIRGRTVADFGAADRGRTPIRAADFSIETATTAGPSGSGLTPRPEPYAPPTSPPEVLLSAWCQTRNLEAVGTLLVRLHDENVPLLFALIKLWCEERTQRTSDECVLLAIRFLLANNEGQKVRELSVALRTYRPQILPELVRRAATQRTSSS